MLIVWFPGGDPVDLFPTHKCHFVFGFLVKIQLTFFLLINVTLGKLLIDGESGTCVGISVH